MEISRLPSSALRLSDIRSHHIIASSHHTVKQLGAPKYSQVSPSRIVFSGRKSCSVLLTNGTHGLKPAPLQVQAQQGAATSEPLKENNADVKKKKMDIHILFRFMRPFAIQFTLVQFSLVLTRTLVENPHVLPRSNWLTLIKIAAVFASIACSNFYIIGINEIFDVDIDKINHPDLPLVTGELPMEVAWVTMLSYVAISLLIAGTLKSMPFLYFIFGEIFLGSIYSIPPLRTKLSTLGAPITNGLGNGFVMFFATITGAGAALGLPFQLSLPMRCMTIYNIIYCFTMGFLKDIPDIEGDSKNNIPTIATIIGARKTLILGTGILVLNHLRMAVIAAIRPQVFKSSIVIPGHIFSIFFLLYQAWKMDQANYAMTESRKRYLNFGRNYLAHMILLPFI